MRFMLRKKKTIVTAPIQVRLRSSVDWRFPKNSPLVRFTACVRGKTAKAKTCIACGNADSGKKVPLTRNIGVIRRNAG